MSVVALLLLYDVTSKSSFDNINVRVCEIIPALATYCYSRVVLVLYYSVKITDCSLGRAT